jgi:hypothetical protein
VRSEEDEFILIDVIDTYINHPSLLLGLIHAFTRFLSVMIVPSIKAVLAIYSQLLVVVYDNG